jgi:amino acid permease
MASPADLSEKGLAADGTKYSKSDGGSGEQNYIVRAEPPLKRQLKNRHVAMIRSVISSMSTNM